MSQHDPEHGSTSSHSVPHNAKAQAKADKAYRKASRPWFKKKRTWILGAILLLILASCLGALSGEDSSNNGTTTSGDTEQQNEQQNEQTTEAPQAAFPGAQPDDVVGTAGDTLDIGEVSVTSTPLVAGDATFESTLCTTATMVNNADEQVDFHAWDWELQAPSGTILNSTVGGSDNTLSGGGIAPGGTATGDVCFEGDPNESGQYVVLYEAMFSFSTDRAAWINDR